MLRRPKSSPPDQASLQTHPYLEDGTAYRGLRATNLYNINNFDVEVQAGAVRVP